MADIEEIILELELQRESQVKGSEIRHCYNEALDRLRVLNSKIEEKKIDKHRCNACCHWTRDDGRFGSCRNITVCHQTLTNSEEWLETREDFGCIYYEEN